MLEYGRQSISEQDVSAMVGVLRSDFLTQGPITQRFESDLASACDTRFAVAVSSATAALHIACLALGVRPGDEVWTSPVSFVASANCARFCGAAVDYIDVDPLTFNMDPNRLESALIAADRENRLPRVVIPVHLGGLPCCMREISELCRRFGVRILQDASHALGASLDGTPVMSSRYGDVAVTSFHPVKMITTAEGGVAVTSEIQIAEKMERLRSHGVTRTPSQMHEAPHGPWYYEQLELGFNYRLPDLLAALGLSQLPRLKKFIEHRTRLANLYRSELSEQLFQMQDIPCGFTSSYHLVIALPDFDVLQTSRVALFERLMARGIRTTVHYRPIYQHPYHRDHLIRQPDCPVAESYYARALTLPCHASMSDADVRMVVEALQDPLPHQIIF